LLQARYFVEMMRDRVFMPLAKSTIKTISATVVNQTDWIRVPGFASASEFSTIIVTSAVIVVAVVIIAFFAAKAVA